MLKRKETKKNLILQCLEPYYAVLSNTANFSLIFISKSLRCKDMELICHWMKLADNCNLKAYAGNSPEPRSP